MRVRYSFSSRRTGHLENIRKQRVKFPKLLEKVIETSDIIIEILDARYFDEMVNEEVEECLERKGKRILYVLNKIDLVKKEDLKANPLLKELKPYVLVSATERIGGKELRAKIKYLAKQVKKDDTKNYDRIQVGVIGYPNAGKSSIINLLVGKTSAPTGAKAGFTKGIQKLKLTKDILLLDSPGVIPEAQYDQDNNKKIAHQTKVGARDWHTVKDPEIVVHELWNEKKGRFKSYYGENKIKTAEELMDHIGEKRGCKKKGGEIDIDRAARLILKDWQDGKIV